MKRTDVLCPQCDTVCGWDYPASPQTWDCAGKPAWREGVGENFQSANGDWFCSAECLRIYTEE